MFVSGSIGDAALGLELRKGGGAGWKLDAAQRQHLLSRYLLPQPRNALAEAVRAHASAAMDISDGLAGDFAKLCRASKVAAEIEVARVPLSEAANAVVAADPAMLETVLTGGDDYEIVCTVPRPRPRPSAPQQKRRTWPSLKSARSRPARASGFSGRMAM